MKKNPEFVGRLARTAFNFAKSIDASGSGTLQQALRQNCTIEKVRVKFYPGPEGDLHIIPYLLKTNDVRYNIIDFPSGSNQYVSGEDEEIVFNVSIPVDVDDIICIEYVNADAVNAHVLSVQVEVDFAGGGMRG